MKSLVFFLLALSATAVAQNGYPSLNNTVQTRPQAIPTSLTTVISQDAYVCYADFTATGQNLLIQDRQVSPIPWINSILGTSGTPTTWIYVPNNGLCRWFPNGFSIQAGATGVTGSLIIKCPAHCALNWGF